MTGDWYVLYVLLCSYCSFRPDIYVLPSDAVCIYGSLAVVHKNLQMVVSRFYSQYGCCTKPTQALYGTVMGMQGVWHN